MSGTTVDSTSSLTATWDSNNDVSKSTQRIRDCQKDHFRYAFLSPALNNYPLPVLLFKTLASENVKPLLLEDKKLIIYIWRQALTFFPAMFKFM